jgi:hypothetical protein
MQKNYYWIFIYFLFNYTLLNAQYKIEASAANSVVDLYVVNPDNSPYTNSPIIFTGAKGNTFNAVTDNKGLVKLNLPIGDQYSITCNNQINDLPITISNRGYGTWTGTRYTYRFIAFTFEYIDQNNKPSKNESITITLNSGEEYQGKTGEDGKVIFYLPVNESFNVSTKHHANIHEFFIADNGYQETTLIFPYIGLSSKEKERRDLQAKQEDARRIKQAIQQEESLVKLRAKQDSIRKVKDAILATQPSTILFFMYHPEITSYGEITIYDEDKNGPVIGSTSKVWSTDIRSFCQSVRSPNNWNVAISKKRGTYKFYAKSSKGYYWEGTYTVKGGRKKDVPIYIKDGKKIIN